MASRTGAPLTDCCLYSHDTIKLNQYENINSFYQYVGGWYNLRNLKISWIFAFGQDLPLHLKQLKTKDKRHRITVFRQWTQAMCHRWAQEYPAHTCSIPATGQEGEHSPAQPLQSPQGSSLGSAGSRQPPEMVRGNSPELTRCQCLPTSHGGKCS